MNEAAQLTEIRAIAQEMYDDSARVEDDAPVEQHQDGCYVQAWVWVPNVYIEPDAEVTCQNVAPHSP